MTSPPIRRARRRVPIRLSKARWLLLTVIMGFVLQASPASAHVIYWRGDMGQTGSFCMRGVSGLEEWEGAGYGHSEVDTYTADPSWAPCYQHPPSYVHEHSIAGFAYFWDFSYGGSWQPCFGSSWLNRNNAASSERWWWLTDPYYGCGSTWYMFYAGLGARDSADAPWIADWKLAGHCCEANDSWYHWYDA